MRSPTTTTPTPYPPLHRGERARVLAAVRRALREAAAERASDCPDRWVDDAVDLVDARLDEFVAIARRCGTDCAGAAAVIERLVCGTCDHRGASGFCALRYLDCCGVYACAAAVVGATVGALRDEGEKPAALMTDATRPA